MARPMVRIYTEPGVFVDREMNDEEFVQYEIDQAQIALENQAKAQTATKKAAALAKLEALGLDEDDLKALGL